MITSPSFATADVSFRPIAYVIFGFSAYEPPGVYGSVSWITV